MRKGAAVNNFVAAHFHAMISKMTKIGIFTLFNFVQDETSNEGLVVDVDGPVTASSSDSHNLPRPSTQFTEPPKVARLGHHFTFGVGGGVRMRPTIRGSSKRGRPRGSRRGGPIGGKGRGILLNPTGTTTGSPGPQSPTSSHLPGSSSSTEQTALHGG